MADLLVTGGAGFIGGRIKEMADAVSFDVVVGQDVLDIDALRAAARGVRGIFHCAAKISVPESFEQPELYHRINVEGTKNVITVAEEIGAKIIFSSSAAVYGEADTRVDESHTLRPQSPYAENKRDCEELLAASSAPSVILRYFNVYGPGQSAAYAGVITAFIRAALSGEDLVIHGDGTQVRDFIYVDDVARANVIAMQAEVGNAERLNIGSGTETSLNDLAALILRLTGSQSTIRYAEPRQGDIKYSQADVSRTKEILGWEAEVSLEEGLKRTIESYRQG